MLEEHEITANQAVIARDLLRAAALDMIKNGKAIDGKAYDVADIETVAFALDGADRIVIEGRAGQ